MYLNSPNDALMIRRCCSEKIYGCIAILFLYFRHHDVRLTNVLNIYETAEQAAKKLHGCPAHVFSTTNLVTFLLSKNPFICVR